MKRFLWNVGVVCFSLFSMLMVLAALHGSTDSGYFLGTKYSERWATGWRAYDGAYTQALVNFMQQNGGKVPDRTDSLQSSGFTWPELRDPMSRSAFVSHCIWMARIQLVAVLCFWTTGLLVYFLRDARRLEIYVAGGAFFLLLSLSFWVGHVGHSKDYVKLYSLASVKENPPAAGTVIAFRPPVDVQHKAMVWFVPTDPESVRPEFRDVGPEEWRRSG